MASPKNTPEMFTVDEVAAMFPDKVRPTAKRLEEFVREHGIYRDVLGKLVMTRQDVDDLMVLFRGQPTSADVKARLDAGRMMLLSPSPHEQGFAVVIGDQLGAETDAQLWIGWAPLGGAGAMLRALQFGNPGHLAVLMAFPSTPQGLMERKQDVWKWRIRTDSANWFFRIPPVATWLDKLREEVHGLSAQQGDTDQ